MNKLNIPDPSQLINNFKLETNFSDITYEDLRDQVLLKELKEKRLIDEEDVNKLTDLGRGIKLKPNKNE